MAKKKITSTPPSVRTSTGSPALIGSLIALGLFLLLPMTQWIENLRTFDPPEVITQELPPPPPPLELDQEEEEEVEEEEIEELEPPPPPPSLEMLELALSADLSSMVGGDFALPSFDVSGDLEDMIFNLDEIDQHPRPVIQPKPQYPIELRRAGIQGEVVVEFVVDENGNVRNPTIYRSENPGFNEAALKAIRGWRFEAGVKDGKKVKVRVRLPMPFVLN